MSETTPEADETTPEDVEGHAMARFDGSEENDDVEGHARAAFDGSDDEDDVEGHGMRV